MSNSKDPVAQPTLARLSAGEQQALEVAFDADPKNRRALLLLAAHYLVTGEAAGPFEGATREALDKTTDGGEAPSRAETEAAIERLMTRYLSSVSGGPSALTALLRSARSPAPRLRAALLIRLAVIQRDSYGDPSGALATLRTALRVQPELEEARTLLKEAQATQQQTPRVAPPTLSRGSGQTGTGLETETLSTLKMEAILKTELSHPGLGAPSESTEEQGLFGDEASDAGLTEASPFAEATPEVQRACDAIQKRGLEPEVALIALAALERAQDRSADRAAVQEAISRTQEQAGDRDRAFYALVRAARQAVPARRVLDELFRLAMLTGAFTELAAVYEDTLSGPLAPADRTYLHLKLGHLFGRELSRPEAARKNYERVLLIEDQNLEALARLAEIHEHAARWDELSTLLERSGEVARANGDLALESRTLRDLARVAEEHLDDSQRATLCYQQLLSLIPGNPAAVAGLRRLAERGLTSTSMEVQTNTGAFVALRSSLEAEGSFEALAEGLSQRAATLGKGESADRIFEAIQLYLDAASVHLKRRGDAAAALIETIRATRLVVAELDGSLASEAEATEPRLESLLETLLETHLLAGLRSETLSGALAVADELLAHLPQTLRGNRLLQLIDFELTQAAGQAQERGSWIARTITLALEFLPAEDSHVFQEVERRLLATGDWKSMIGFYSDFAQNAGPALRRELTFKEAELRESEFQDLAGARELYQRLLIANPNSVQALEAFLRLCKVTQEEPSLVSTLESLLAPEPAPQSADGAANATKTTQASVGESALTQATRMTLLLTLGAALRSSDPRRARALYAELLTLDPKQVEALEGTAELAQNAGDLKESAAALERRLRDLSLGEPGRAEGYRHLARLYDSERLTRPKRALKAWEELHRELPDDSETLEQLTHAYGGGRNPEALLVLLSDRLKQAPQAEAATSWRRELVGAYHRLGRAEQSATLWEEALAANAGDLEALGELVAFHTARRHWEAVERYTLAWIEAEVDQVRKTELLVQLGRLRANNREDPVGARQALEHALHLSPSHPTAFSLLAEQLREDRDDRGLFSLLNRSLESHTLPRERAPLLRELWQVGDRMREAGVLRAGKRAALALKELCLLTPEDAALWEALGQVLNEPSVAAELASLQEARAARLDGAGRAEALLQAAKAWVRSEGPVAQRGQERARRCLERARAAAPAGHPLSVRVREALLPLYRELGAWEALAGVLEELCDPATGAPPASISSAMEELAYTLQERLLRASEALVWLERLVALPESEGREEQLSRLCTLEAELGRWDSVYEHLGDRIRLHRGQPEEPELRLQAARVGWRRLGDPNKAIGHLRAVLALRPEDEALLQDLERACGEAGRQSEFASILAEEAALCSDPKKRADRLVRAGVIKEQSLGDLAGARRDYLTALGAKEAPAVVRQAARDGLARTLSALREFEALAELLRDWIEEVESEEERADLCLNLGLIYEEQLHAPERAMASYRRELEADPGDLAALDALARVSEAAGDLQTALEMRTRQAAELEAPTARANILFRIAKLQARQGEAPAAADTLRAAIESDGGRLDLRQMLLTLLTEAQDFEGIEAVARTLAVNAPTSDARAAAWCQVGHALLALERPGESQAAFEHALAIDETLPDAALALAQLRRNLAEPAELLILLEAALPRAKRDASLDRQVEIQAMIGELANAQGDLERASSAFDRAARHASMGDSARLALSRALARAGRPKQASRQLRRLLREQDPSAAPALLPDRTDLRLELGKMLLADQCPEEAITTFQEALSARPEDPEILEALAETFEVCGRFEELLEVLATLRALELSAARTEAMSLEMAQICSARLGDLRRATEVLEEGLGDPPAPSILKLLMEEHSRLGNFEEAIRRAEQLLKLGAGPRARSRLELQLASFYTKLPSRASEALDLVRRALTHAPTDALREEALRLGRELADRDQDGELLCAILELLLEQGAGDEEAELLRELVETERYVRNNEGAAIEGLRRLLLLDPEDSKASEDLARLLELSGRNEEALAAYQRLLDLAPHEPAAHQGLVRCFEACDLSDGLQLSLSLLPTLGLVDPRSDAAQQTLRRSWEQCSGVLETETREAGLYPPGLLGAEASLAQALGHAGVAAALEFFRAAAPPLGRPCESLALLDQVSTLAELLGLPIPSVVFNADGAENLGALNSPEPHCALTACIALPEADYGQGREPGELRFELAQAIVAASARCAAASFLTPDELERLFLAACALGDSLRNGTRLKLSPLAKVLQEGVEASNHAALLQAAARYRAQAESEGVSIPRYLEGAQLAGLRAGLLLSGSPQLALRALGRQSKGTRSAIRTLLRFTVDKRHLQLRERLGIAV